MSIASSISLAPASVIIVGIPGPIPPVARLSTHSFFWIVQLINMLTYAKHEVPTLSSLDTERLPPRSNSITNVILLDILIPSREFLSNTCPQSFEEVMGRSSGGKPCMMLLDSPMRAAHAL